MKKKTILSIKLCAVYPIQKFYGIILRLDNIHWSAKICQREHFFFFSISPDSDEVYIYTLYNFLINMYLFCWKEVMDFSSLCQFGQPDQYY